MVIMERVEEEEEGEMEEDGVTEEKKEEDGEGREAGEEEGEGSVIGEDEEGEIMREAGMMEMETKMERDKEVRSSYHF